MINMDLSVFLMENVETELTDEVIISKRFKNKDGQPIKFKIKAITATRDTQIKKQCEKREINKTTGQLMITTDYDEYLARLVTECTVYPNFKSKELQTSWGVLGADQLINKMLLPGELTELSKHIQRLNGFETIEELKTEVKEPLTEETRQ